MSRAGSALVASASPADSAGSVAPGGIGVGGWPSAIHRHQQHSQQQQQLPSWIPPQEAQPQPSAAWSSPGFQRQRQQQQSPPPSSQRWSFQQPQPANALSAATAALGSSAAAGMPFSAAPPPPPRTFSSSSSSARGPTMRLSGMKRRTMEEDSRNLEFPGPVQPSSLQQQEVLGGCADQLDQLDQPMKRLRMTDSPPPPRPPSQASRDHWPLPAQSQLPPSPQQQQQQQQQQRRRRHILRAVRRDPQQPQQQPASAQAPAGGRHGLTGQRRTRADFEEAAQDDLQPPQLQREDSAKRLRCQFQPPQAAAAAPWSAAAASGWIGNGSGSAFDRNGHGGNAVVVEEFNSGDDEDYVTADRDFQRRRPSPTLRSSVRVELAEGEDGWIEQITTDGKIQEPAEGPRPRFTQRPTDEYRQLIRVNGSGDGGRLFPRTNAKDQLHHSRCPELLRQQLQPATAAPSPFAGLQSEEDLGLLQTGDGGGRRRRRKPSGAPDSYCAFCGSTLQPAAVMQVIQGVRMGARIPEICSPGLLRAQQQQQQHTPPLLEHVPRQLTDPTPSERAAMQVDDEDNDRAGEDAEDADDEDDEYDEDNALMDMDMAESPRTRSNRLGWPSMPPVLSTNQPQYPQQQQPGFRGTHQHHLPPTTGVGGRPVPAWPGVPPRHLPQQPRPLTPQSRPLHTRNNAQFF